MKTKTIVFIVVAAIMGISLFLLAVASAFFLVVIGTAGFVNAYENYNPITKGEYPWDPDNVHMFGDGRWQIGCGGDVNFLICYDRLDETAKETGVLGYEQIDRYVTAYREKEPYGYVIGEAGYTVFNYITGDEWIQKAELTDLPEEYHAVFAETKKFRHLKNGD